MTFFKQIILSFLSRAAVKSVNILICQAIYFLFQCLREWDYINKLIIGK